MKKTFTLISSLISLSVFAQTQITNGDFELWGNASPGVSAEPTNWYSNKSGSSVAQLGPQICYQDGTIKHGGSYSVRVETTSYFGTAVNGAVTTGVIDAPNLTKSNGYIGTVNYSTASDDRRMAFTGRPDSLVGYYQYTSGGAGEMGKVTAILHNNDYYDPETPTTYHPDPTADKIARATYFTPTSNVSTWTRFSVPFVYTSASNPSYIMVNITSSADQTTSITGSKMWIDDLQVIYNLAPSGINEKNKNNFKAYCFNRNMYIDLSGQNEDKAVLNILDLAGQIIQTKTLNKNEMNVVTLNVNSGMYLYQVVGSGMQQSGKIVIE